MSQDKSFFVSRSELLAWLNNLLEINYTKVEECASGTSARSIRVCVLSSAAVRVL